MCLVVPVALSRPELIEAGKLALIHSILLAQNRLGRDNGCNIVIVYGVATVRNHYCLDLINEILNI